MNSTISEIELKPCPFCNSDNVAFDKEEDAVFCLECGAGGPIAHSQVRAIKFWNAREAQSDTKATEEEEQALLRDVLNPAKKEKEYHD